MREHKCVRPLSLLLALVMVLGTFAVVPMGASAAGGASQGQMSGGLTADSYEAYIKPYTSTSDGPLANQKNFGAGMEEIRLNLFDYTTSLPSASYDGAFAAFAPSARTVYRLSDVPGASAALFTPDSGSLTWSFEVPQLQLRGEGRDDRGYLYMLKIEYYPINVADTVSTVERVFALDDEVPFAQARSFSFTKNWVYGYTAENGEQKKEYHITEGGTGLFHDTVTDFLYEKDKGGNDLRYTAMQDPKWQTYYAQDVDGFYQGNFYFFLEAEPKLKEDGTPAEARKHSITLTGARENILIKSISLVPAQEDTVPTYAEYLAKYAGKADDAANGGSITTIQAEFPTHVSDTSVYPSNDRSSAITQPSSPSSQLMNTIGGKSYNTVGQWASYKFTVSKSGWYNMTMRYRQNLLDGLFVSRAIKLSGGDYGLPDGTPTVPFREAYCARFDYSKDWQVGNLGTVVDGQNTDFKFYFEEGKEYTVYYEVSLGDLSSIIKRVQDSLSVINDCYLSIIKLTGASPDQYRDYGFKEIMPEVLRALLRQAEELDAVSREFVAMAGSKGSQVATLDQISLLLRKMGSKESEVAKNLSSLKANIGTLGTWLNNVKQQSLVVDYVNIQPLAEELPRDNANIFEAAWFEIRAFFISFFVDYNSMGVKEGEEIAEDAGIDVWLAYGRDQSLIWRSLIDSDFTPQYNIPVHLKLVAAGTLLPSVLSGSGPNVYIGLGSADVINYAIRGAVDSIESLPGYIDTYGYDVPLTETAEGSYQRTYYIDSLYFDTDGDGTLSDAEKAAITHCYVDEAHTKQYVKGYNVLPDGTTETIYGTKFEVKPENIAFNYANTIPLSLLDKTYGVPETTNFQMMFYRMDVLSELGVDLPATWDDLLESLTVFQSNNMKTGLTYLTGLTTFIYQKGGSQWLYENPSEYEDPSQWSPNHAGAAIGFGTDIALEAFRFCCRLYTDYSFDVSFDAPNRFRTGEMPIVMTDYCTMYNQLTVFATEIRGLWSFARLPGFQQVDGDNKLMVDSEGNPVINNCAVATLTATVMLYKENNEQLLNSWEYMKWQASADAQAKYGNQMVATVGPAAKYATANSQALRNLSWSSSELASLLEQFDNLAAVPSYPGTYIIARYIQFAFLAAVNEGADPVDELSGYLTIINRELTRKRLEFEEFNLWVPSYDGETPPGYHVDD